ncbi:hypothetical protein MSAN_00255700 [Mycena sanguinolenta]|uniref:MYND-type domain-containing protein n=1 Tax=Mycena sanguinolenta TaxID=230812 RepID=A0A8H6ZG05_9AGAR|nr:hypothetical protein MSAN_00255700 [Mycena sanguinolenta]
MSSPSDDSSSPPLSPAAEAVIKTGDSCFPDDWNAYFELIYLDKYGPNADIKAWILKNPDIEMLPYLGNVNACNMQLSMTSKILLESEGMLVCLAIEQLNYNDFEAKWAALEVTERRRIALDGLVRGACSAREKSRADCPEMSLSGLVGDGQYSLVNLLKAIVMHDPAATFRIRSLYLFHHPAVEQEFDLFTNESAADNFRAVGHLRLLHRNRFIVEALIGILEAYAGKPAPKISLREEMESERMPSCFACGTESTEKFPVTLKRCSGCKTAWYCSKVCQDRDWKEHKKFCGGRSTKFDPALITPTSNDLAPAEFIGCPAPDPGFVRGPALWRQIWYLPKKDSYDRDYHMSVPASTSRIYIALTKFESHSSLTPRQAARAPSALVIPSDAAVSLMFYIARRRAMASGDLGAVCKMHSILQDLQRTGTVNLTADQIRDQLEREYRVVLVPAVPFGSPPTMQELNEEMDYALRRRKLAYKQAEADEKWNAGAMADVVSEWDKGDESDAGERERCG